MVYGSDFIEYFIENNIPDELVKFSEEKHKMQYEMLLYGLKYADLGNNDSNITDGIFVTGPSASGKTTFTNILKEKLTEFGYHCSVISLDNYFLSRKEIVRKQFGKDAPADAWEEADFESPDALDIKFFRKQMKEFARGKEITIPEYDFTLGARVPGKQKIKPTQKDMLLIEGIHAINPLITKRLPFRKKYNVYICPFDEYKVKDGDREYTIRPNQIRMMRRAYRDSLHRNAPLSVNLKMLPNVRKGEELYIKPQKKYADFFFNTSVTYELPFLAGKFLEMTDTLNEEEKKMLSEYIDTEVLKKIRPFYGYDVPNSSVFSEFCR